MSPGLKQREVCPSIVSSASDERMPQRSSTAVRMYENCTLNSDRYTELWTCDSGADLGGVAPGARAPPPPSRRSNYIFMLRNRTADVNGCSV